MVSFLCEALCKTDRRRNGDQCQLHTTLLALIMLKNRQKSTLSIFFSGIIGELHRDHFRDDYTETYHLAVNHTRRLRAAEVELVHLEDKKVERFRLLEDFEKVSLK